MFKSLLHSVGCVSIHPGSVFGQMIVTLSYTFLAYNYFPVLPLIFGKSLLYWTHYVIPINITSGLFLDELSSP